MNLLELIKSVLSFQDWKEQSALPGWRPRPTRMRHSRTAFSSSRRREPGPQKIHIEEFADKDLRNQRFHELRAGKTKHVSKFSTVRDNRSVWCIARP